MMCRMCGESKPRSGFTFSVEFGICDECLEVITSDGGQDEMQDVRGIEGEDRLRDLRGLPGDHQRSEKEARADSRSQDSQLRGRRRAHVGAQRESNILPELR